MPAVMSTTDKVIDETIELFEGLPNSPIDDVTLFRKRILLHRCRRSIRNLA
ncbi:hypothetical protein [Vibrio taketomensis]|uniref:hypothetical protein n=1 Tax=Vibrio taketomensis TaxID=2572923 RepID=UPI0018D8C3B5|nr:hypothetical protein [Vibrio taketomensis]